MAAGKRSKNQLRRERQKQRKLNTDSGAKAEVAEASSDKNVDKTQPSRANEPVIAEQIEDDPLYNQFEGVFHKWGRTEASEKEENTQVYRTVLNLSSEDESEPEVVHKKATKRQKIPLADLKSSTNRPQVVEWHDQDAPDPFFLVSIKSQPNIVQVPEHWSAKRDYLANRRGFEKTPFQLPHYIQETGIQEMRNNDADKTLKQLQRDRVQPKMGRLDLDYRKLHVAFFEKQAPPRLFGYGDIYYEGRELSDVHTDAIESIRPGEVSKELRQALGILTSEKSPPPWITIMSSLGKPPAYRDLVIPGLDVPYANTGYRDTIEPPAAKQDLWGKLEEAEESEDEGEEDDERENAEEDEDAEEEDEPQVVEEKAPISEFSTDIPTFSKPITPASSINKSLYTVVDEKATKSGNNVMPSQKGYNFDKSEHEENKKHVAEEAKQRKKYKF